MKRIMVVCLIAAMMFAGKVYGLGGTGDGTPPPTAGNAQTMENQIDVRAGQNVSVVGGGDAEANAGGGLGVGIGGNPSSDAIASVKIDTTSISNYKQRTSPLTTYPPYLPFWNHGGWGTIKAYFPNGPNGDSQAYERTFNSEDPDDMEELREVLTSPPFLGPIEFLAGLWNSATASLFGDPYYPHRGRGFEVSNSLIKARRPGGKPLLVFVDSNVDKNLLKEEFYAYVGKVGIEAKVDRNWDQAYDAAVAEALPWDVDVLLVSGGMKGVTVGSNVAFPGAAMGYSQANYSLSLFGAAASGITEGKGKPMVSAEGYRFWPEAIRRRKILQDVAARIYVRPQAEPGQKPAQAATPSPVSNDNGKKAAVGETSKPVQ